MLSVRFNMQRIGFPFSFLIIHLLSQQDQIAFRTMNDLKARAVLLQLRFRDSNLNLKLHVGLLNSKLDQSPHFLRPLRPAIAVTIYILTLGCLIPLDPSCLFHSTLQKLSIYEGTTMRAGCRRFLLASDAISLKTATASGRKNQPCFHQRKVKSMSLSAPPVSLFPV
jgi:hypothetical protein